MIYPYHLVMELLNPEQSMRGTNSTIVLLGKDGKPVAVIEAKKTSKDAEYSGPLRQDSI